MKISTIELVYPQEHVMFTGSGTVTLYGIGKQDQILSVDFVKPTTAG